MVAYGFNAALVPVPRHSSFNPMLRILHHLLRLRLPEAERERDLLHARGGVDPDAVEAGQRFSA